uniref:Uncharacterized protein n=1 Tax=Candidatus Kentrum sp. LFY TaxID=2126342 RepID=A0A450UA52_9GAMM|nr:MAG: hypothetical protein BECKLFY1418B_GA0070995_10138 [Candidatus Kentron sp. LFY]
MALPCNRIESLSFDAGIGRTRILGNPAPEPISAQGAVSRGSFLFGCGPVAPGILPSSIVVLPRCLDRFFRHLVGRKIVTPIFYSLCVPLWFVDFPLDFAQAPFEPEVLVYRNAAPAHHHGHGHDHA